MQCDIVHVGTNNDIELCNHDTDSKTTFPKILVPFGLPPVISEFKSELEAVLSCPEKLYIHSVKEDARFIKRNTLPERLFNTNFYPVQTTICVTRSHTTGEILDVAEDGVSLASGSGDSVTSLQRPPGPPSDGVRGSSSGIPFWPGGLEEPSLEHLPAAIDTVVDLEKDLLSVPPGFKSGMDFSHVTSGFSSTVHSDHATIDLANILDADDMVDWQDDHSTHVPVTVAQEKAADVAVTEISNRLDEVITLEHVDSAASVARRQEQVHTEWAVPVKLDAPLSDFHERVPNMAHKWPFELDAFQKWAVVHLEQHHDVFVAAHTSAGKTVVAEYAIALGLSHMTRCVYTSPIKALSNQKFREFRNTFGDDNIGLITGDVQVKSEASCIIMTTEILRSILYRGSDLVRDLEWVIFDEVHYVNDPERGVVWEEVLIMLPAHVSIIMLSATVPNPLEFAEWVGRIKKRCVHVISTTKRPVPLEHFLFTGNSPKTASELFLLMGADKQFLTDGYNKALNARKERESKQQQNYGPKGSGHSHYHPQQDKNTWLAIIDMLQHRDKLPAVAFIFSRKRIHDLVEMLSSVELTDKGERSQIEVFVKTSIDRLKGSDRQLGQIALIRRLLLRGIGIHHSGVLPIMKEVVEILFQRSLVKILFATETFAMGVNMPARTVIFDSIRKFDGNGLRNLLPGEYTQMAGRAGRRGLDATGTVIIVCKKEVPEMAELHKMLLGQATLLKSQFRLTYSMILNLLRVEKLRIEDMMKRSFSEFHSQKNVAGLEQNLEVIERELKTLPDTLYFSTDLHEYYAGCCEYWLLKKDIQTKLASYPQTAKALVAGRVVTVATANHEQTPAIIVQPGKERVFTVLLLCDKEAESADGTTAQKPVSSILLTNACDVRPVTEVAYFRPDRGCNHRLLDVKFSDIATITGKTLKINAPNIISDCQKRQQPRFRNDLPGQSVASAIQDLLKLVDTKSLAALELEANDLDLVEGRQRLAYLADSLPKYMCTRQHDFTDQFERLRKRRQLEEERAKIKFGLSEDSLELLPEFKCRLELLKQLDCIDKTAMVLLKGRVACEINAHEILVTELIFHNFFSALDPATIAAILSSTVMEDKNAPEPDLDVLPAKLVQAREEFLRIAHQVDLAQQSCRVVQDNYMEQFRFGLMEVVYDWAQGKPFVEIASKTTVQEGVIVRSIQRLDEVLRDVKDASRIVGDESLKFKMEEASNLIKRDIIFATSLYINNM